MRRYLHLLLGICLAGTIGHAVANNPRDCPSVIASIEYSAFLQDLAKITSQVYRDLGCNAAFVALPSKRAIISFNSGKVDGEASRLEIVEQQYSVGFVRSSQPLLVIENNIWHDPERQTRDDPPIAYVLGIAWQQAYMEGKSGVAFNNFQELYDAFNRGRVERFLASSTNIRYALAGGTLLKRPAVYQKVYAGGLFHYLRKEFAPFMQRFSQYLEQQKPYDNF